VPFAGINDDDMIPSTHSLIRVGYPFLQTTYLLELPIWESVNSRSRFPGSESLTVTYPDTVIIIVRTFPLPWSHRLRSVYCSEPSDSYDERELVNFTDGPFALAVRVSSQKDIWIDLKD